MRFPEKRRVEESKETHDGGTKKCKKQYQERGTQSNL